MRRARCEGGKKVRTRRPMKTKSKENLSTPDPAQQPRIDRLQRRGCHRARPHQRIAQFPASPPPQRPPQYLCFCSPHSTCDVGSPLKYRRPYPRLAAEPRLSTPHPPCQVSMPSNPSLRLSAAPEFPNLALLVVLRSTALRALRCYCVPDLLSVLITIRTAEASCPNLVSFRVCISPIFPPPYLR